MAAIALHGGQKKTRFLFRIPLGSTNLEASILIPDEI